MNSRNYTAYEITNTPRNTPHKITLLEIIDYHQIYKYEYTRLVIKQDNQNDLIWSDELVHSVNYTIYK